MSINNFTDELIKFIWVEHQTQRYKRNVIITLILSILYGVSFFDRLTSDENITIILHCLALVTLWNFSKWIILNIQYIKANNRCKQLAKEMIPECTNDILNVITTFPEEEQQEFLIALDFIENSSEPVVIKLGKILPLRVSAHLYNIGVTELPCDEQSIQMAASKSFDNLAEKRDAASIEKIRSINSSLLALEKLIPACYKIIQTQI